MSNLDPPQGRRRPGLGNLTREGVTDGSPTSTRGGSVPLPAERLRPRPLRRAAAPLRRAGGGAVLRAEPPVAHRDGRCGGPRTVGTAADPRRGHRHGRRRCDADRAHRCRGGRHRPHRADAPGGPLPRGRRGSSRPGRPGLWPCRAAALPRRGVRRPDLHLPPPLRRRPGRHGARAGPRGAAGRDLVVAGVLRAPATPPAAGLASRHPSGASDRELPRRRTRVGQGGPLPGPVHRGALPPLPGRRPRRPLARRRPGRRAGAPDESRRGGGGVGGEAGWGGPGWVRGGGWGGGGGSRRAGPSPTPPRAFSARGGGRAADWWPLPPPPYTLWHLSYVVLGAALAASVDWTALTATVLAFFL